MRVDGNARHVEARSGVYRDSVRLMEISSALTRQPGVESALVAMATAVNLEMLDTLGLDAPPSGPNDMLVAIVATDADALAGALDQLEQELSGSPSLVDTSAAPSKARTTSTAVASLDPAATVVLVSTPGQHAFVEAMDALDAGASVMLFSDNVPVWQEVRLKERAAARGLLVMGPDCGTAVVGGVGLGFANVVRPGPVGLVAASGTGAQQVMALLSQVPGAGIAHCLGVGGRDLSAAVGGRATHAALDQLDADPETRLIVVIGKPPAEEVGAAVREHAARLATPVLVAPLGDGHPDLTGIAEEILRRLDLAAPAWPAWPVPRTTTGSVVGLFSGGTLCAESMLVASPMLGRIWSNVPLHPEWRVSGPASGHVMLDLGADEYTVGRPHPMIDFGPRIGLIENPPAGCGVLLLDVVLGHAAHPDPASELAPVIARAPVDVVVSVIGTQDDPQNLPAQVAALREAGASVFASNAEATRHAVRTVADS